ncbi:unnamed protein product [Adineta ricciae]|uniref:Uncharacterized protein n=1 Tax=Adineta ricciae TaxID=249248 RepID=A0A816BCH6_ADIRI|nr:unnamed protein product [Adineta ricciae]CAF1607433.1 unnamed protein product [Adineta ricciae]
MLPVCGSQPMLVPVMPQMLVPMMPVQPAPMCCPPNFMSACLTTTMESVCNSRMYGQFRHVPRELPGYRHAPFDWYRPPKQRFNVIHEDAAVVTLDGPMPIGDFYRYYIYGDDMGDYEYDDYEDGSSYASADYDNISRNTINSRQTRSQDDQEERYSNLSPNRANTYSTLDPARRRAMPPSSNYRQNRPTPANDDFDDAASVNSTYGN